MPLVKSVHVGGIDLHHERVCTIVKSNRQHLLYELNNWLFDYLHSHKMDIKQLPPLDDWTRSDEDHTFWSIAFPTDEWHIWVRAEPVEF